MAGNDVKEIEAFAASSGEVARKDHAFYASFLRFVATMTKFWSANNTRLDALAARLHTLDGLSE